MDHGHGHLVVAWSAALGLCMTMLGLCGALSVSKHFVNATLLMVALIVVTLTVIVALEVMYASEMHC